MFSNAHSIFAAALLATTVFAQDVRNIGPYTKGIGNSYLGGSVVVSGALTRTTITSSRADVTRTGRATLGMSVNGSILRQSFRALQADLIGQNTLTERLAMPPIQRATGSFRLQLCDQTVCDRSVSTTGNLGGIPETTYNLFPRDVECGVPVGPFTVTLGGNAGVTLGAGAMVVLPATTPEVRLIAAGNTALVGRAYVKVGVWGFGAGVELAARFAEQRLTMGVTANVLTGLSGSVGYQIQAMSLRLIAFLEAFWARVYSHTLTSWGSSDLFRELLN